MNRSAKKIPVLLAGPYSKPGGMTGTFGRILNNMHQSSVFAQEVEFIPFRLTLPADGSLPKRWWIDMVRLCDSIRRKPTIMHLITQKYYSTFREYPLVRTARACGVKTIVDVRAGSLQAMLKRTTHRLQNLLMRSILLRADRLVLECKKDVPFVQNEFFRDSLFLPNTILESDFTRTVPARLTLTAGQPLKLIYSGRYTAAKGLPVMMQALDVLSARRVPVELHLTGQGAEPVIAELIRRYSAHPPPGTSLIDHGWDVPDLYALLASAHVFVMPTQHPGEGHSNSVSEAMMAGLGMILADWLHREDIVPEKGAIVVPAQNPAALADAAESYFHNPELLQMAGRTNRAFVEENYLDSICFPRLLDLYRHLAGV